MNSKNRVSDFWLIGALGGLLGVFGILLSRPGTKPPEPKAVSAPARLMTAAAPLKSAPSGVIFQVSVPNDIPAGSLLQFVAADAPAPTPTPPTIPSFPVPAGFETVCALPSLPIFSVKDYGAMGDNQSDDTVSIRNALAAAVAKGGGIVYLPTGVYKVCPQAGDNNPSQVWFPIFRINTGNIVFAGDGPGKSVLSGFCAGMKDPKTTWTTTTDGYVKISRFFMFGVAYDYEGLAPIDTLQFRGLTIDGNAGWTGNYLVGGDVQSGDGWDLGHKGLALAGSQPISNVLSFMCEWRNWRGEIIYSGAASCWPFNIVSSLITSSNASAVSVGGCTIAYTTIGGAGPLAVPSGGECYCRTPGTGNKLLNSNVTALANGFTHLGLPGTTLLVDGANFTNCGKAILLSDSANDWTVQNSVFNGNQQCIIASSLNLYPADPHGFTNGTIQGCTNNGSGALYISQGASVPNLVLRSNTINPGAAPGACLLQGSFPGDMPGFIADSNIIATGASDILSYTGNCAVWTNTIRQSGSNVGCKNDEFSPETVAIFNPQIASDATRINATPAGGQAWGILPSQLPLYPVGFTTIVFSTGGPGNYFKPDPSWNAFTANVVIPVQTGGVGGVTIRKNAAGLFELAN